MTPEGLARRRFLILTLLRFSGVALMLAGLWIWHGGIVRAGGAPEIGAPLFGVGAIDSLLIPFFLRRAWRTPRDR